MTTIEFQKYWKKNYPDSLPIANEIGMNFEKRWFRIHSLPNSKRYADNDFEYGIILERQNRLISDLFGESLDFQVLISLFNNDSMNENYEFLDYLNKFQKIETIDLHKERPDYYDKKMFCDIFIKQEKWKINEFNEILRKIADDEIRSIFINSRKNCLIIPYDGGVDIILKDKETRDKFKTKYSDWISEREDGL